MSLEFSAIDLKSPDFDLSVAIPLQAHEYIMLKSQEYQLKLLSRMADYWEDTVYAHDELSHLLMELSQLRKLLNPHEPNAEQMANLFERMDTVITKAQEIGGFIEAIAD
jgi:hypothetical protein